MAVIYLIVITVLVFLLIMSRREIISKHIVIPKWRVPFYKMAQYVVREIARKMYSEQVHKNIQKLYPNRQVQWRMQQHYVEKVSLVLLAVFMGTFLALGIYLENKIHFGLIEENKIKREEWNEGSYEISLQAENDENAKVEMALRIEARKMTYEEADKKAQELIMILPELILKENSSIHYITGDLNLVDKVPAYPFVIYWETENRRVIGTDGKLYNHEISKAGEEVELYAQLTYEEDMWESTIKLKLYPAQLELAKEWQLAVEEVLQNIQNDTRHEESFLLPDQINGHQIRWSRQAADSSGYFWILCLISSVVIYQAKDIRLQKEVEKRHKQLLWEYPQFINKLALYMATGITLKAAWGKMVASYKMNERKKHKKVLIYEEMTISYYELENGREEGDIFYRFGIRCHDAKYRKIAGLLCANLHKGNDKLLHMMQAEAELALEERKQNARRFGEEANVKLLLPMTMMLGIVMLIIMIPAYATFIS